MILLKIRNVNLSRLNLILGKSSFRLKNSIKELNSIQLNNQINYSTAIKQPIRKNEFERDLLVYELRKISNLVYTTIAGSIGFILTVTFSILVQNLRTVNQEIKKDEFIELELRNQRSRAFMYFVSEFVSNHRKAVGVVSFTFGSAIAAACTLYVVSSIRSITLLKGGHDLMIKLFRFNPLSTDFKTIKIPLADLCVHGTRRDKTKFIQMTVRNHRGFYLLDKDGEFNPYLFDKIVGLFRNVRKT